MNRDNNRRVINLVLCCSLAAFLGCGEKKKPMAMQDTCEKEGTCCPKPDAQPEPETVKGPEKELTRDEVLSERCEHKMPMYQCDECRYEVGAVKVNPALFKDQSPEGIIRLVHPRQRPAASRLAVTGEIQANDNRTVHITARIPGVIRSVHADLGSAIKAGDLLLEIDSIAVGKAAAEYEKNLSLAALAARAVGREQKLTKEKISPESDLIEAQVKQEEVRTALRAAEQELRTLGLSDTDLESLKSGRADRPKSLLPIRAPQDGIIIARHAATGEATEGGEDLMVLSDTSQVWAWLDLTDRDLAPLQAAQETAPVPVEVRVRAFPGRVFTGRVERVGALMDKETRTVKARALIANPQGLLRPGMFCETLSILGSSDRVWVIPKEAVVSDAGVDFVFKPLTDDYYYRRNVKLGRVYSDGVEVTAGVAPEDTLVGEGVFMLKSDVLRSKMGAGCAD